MLNSFALIIVIGSVNFFRSLSYISEIRPIGENPTPNLHEQNTTNSYSTTSIQGSFSI